MSETQNEYVRNQREAELPEDFFGKGPAPKCEDTDPAKDAFEEITKVAEGMER